MLELGVIHGVVEKFGRLVHLQRRPARPGQGQLPRIPPENPAMSAESSRRSREAGVLKPVAEAAAAVEDDNKVEKLPTRKRG